MKDLSRLVRTRLEGSSGLKVITAEICSGVTSCIGPFLASRNHNNMHHLITDTKHDGKR